MSENFSTERQMQRQRKCLGEKKTTHQSMFMRIASFHVALSAFFGFVLLWLCTFKYRRFNLNLLQFFLSSFICCLSCSFSFLCFLSYSTVMFFFIAVCCFYVAKQFHVSHLLLRKQWERSKRENTIIGT